MIVFLRCGDIPDGGKSLNWLTKEREAGLSVYEGIIREGRAQILLPKATLSACVTLSGCIERSVCVVVGDVIGIGSDGEPLLNNFEVIGEVGLLTNAPTLPHKGISHIMIKGDVSYRLYEGIIQSSSARILLPKATYDECVNLSANIEGIAYEVDGSLDGYKSNGEPILSKIRIVRRISLA